MIKAAQAAEMLPEFLSAVELHAQWQPYVTGPEMEFIDYRAKEPSKLGGGVYLLFDDDAVLLYVGKSLDIHYRCAQHTWAMQRARLPLFRYVAAIDVPNELMEPVEVAHIYALNPPRNNLYDRIRCDWHDDMVAAIRKSWGIDK